MSGGGVLQHLLAEQQSYWEQSDNQQRSLEAVQISNEFCPANLLSTQTGEISKYASTPTRRALSDESPQVEHRLRGNKLLNQSGPRVEELSSRGKSITNSTPRKSRTHAARDELINSNSGLLSRLREEFRPIAGSYQHHSKRVKDAVTSSTNTSTTNGQKALANLSSPASAGRMFAGHPKSNSTGEDYSCADRKTKAVSSKLFKRRGKTSTQVMRSKSLHSPDNPTPFKSLHYRPQVDISVKPESNDNFPVARKRSDASTASSGSSVASEKQRSYGSLTEGIFQSPINEDSSNTLVDAPRAVLRNGRKFETGNSQLVKQQKISHVQSNMVVTPSGMGGLPQTSIQQNNPHGPFYATVPPNPISNHQTNQKHSPVLPQQPPVTQSTVAPRGPPPPYPETTGYDNAGHPQRPNSLSLSGQISRKKMEYGGAHGNVGGLTSPAIATTSHLNNFTYPMSAGTPIHESLFFNSSSSASTIPASTINTSSESGLQGFIKASEAQQTHLQRDGSHNGFQQIVSTSIAQTAETAMIASNGTNNATYQQSRYEQSRNESSSSSLTPQNLFTSSPIPTALPITEVPASHTLGSGTTSNGFSLGKSDSNASTSSGGSRIARRTKRNSRNCSNASGSSSSTGNSRPNSSSDYLDRILNENEVLKSQLYAVERKLKKYQNVENELSQVSENYNTLQASVTKTENMQAALIAQLEAANGRTQQENEILRERINTLTELVETLQFSGKTSQNQTEDIMSYKIKVQELQAKERELIAQLEEAQDKISEQTQDITLLSSSLERMQSTAASLKEKLLEKRRLDQYAEDLSPFLDALKHTLAARLQAEREMEIASIAQRQSTSSNDEGISEMDTTENPSHKQSCSMHSAASSDEQVIRAHAEMLKWQHAYLQTALLRELSARDGTCGSSNSHLYSVLYKHRHAVSEPSSNKSTSLELPLWTTYRPRLDLKKDVTPIELKKLKQDRRRDRTTSEHKCSSPRPGREDNTLCAIQSRSSEILDTQMREKVNPGRNSNSSLQANGQKSSDKPTSSNSETHTSNEVDSPSEGYHSQQSSGSPTPSSERSSVHFPEGDNRVNAALNPSLDQDICTSTFSQPTSGVSRQAVSIPGLAAQTPNSAMGKTILTKVVDV